tara:strand:+ start:507 stop:1094 length:588 start_codon:yes stop_codon:yes gene_type:complete
MKIVGLTGGIGSGKSTVLSYFKDLGVKTYNSDVSAKNLINSDKDLIKKIKKSFGNNIYRNKILDSKKLSKIVFGDSDKLKLLNSIIHPAVSLDFSLFLNSIKEDYIVKEAAIIFEINSQMNYDKIILVRSSKAQRIDRVIKRDKITKQEVVNKMDNQIDDKSLLTECDYIIDNNDNFNNLKNKVLEIHKDIMTQI